jgi:hypothetical protein
MKQPSQKRHTANAAAETIEEHFNKKNFSILSLIMVQCIRFYWNKNKLQTENYIKNFINCHLMK